MNPLVQVAVKTPVYGVFDYRWKSPLPAVAGTRVTVPFGRRQVIGIVVAAIEHSDVPAAKLRAVHKVHDEKAILPEDLMTLLKWASRYYHYPLGEVLGSALPSLLRKGHAATLAEREYFRSTPQDESSTDVRVTVVQKRLLDHLRGSGGRPVAPDSLRALSPRWRHSLEPLIEQGLVACDTAIEVPRNEAAEQGPTLSDEQARAVEAVNAKLGTFASFLLRGVTGSGKTEVYLRCIEEVSRRGLQVLVLVPEISLTPQLMSRFERRISGCLVNLHSGLNDTERLQNWLCAYEGHADVVIGTRSSILAPMPRLGLIIIDEEHDGSLKQQDGFRYHARDLALMRARNRQCPVLLGTATPSFESIHNVTAGRFVELALTRRAGDAVAPTMGLLDIRRRKLIEGMSDRLLDAIREHLGRGGQALVFINRRGFAPTLLCNDCGAAADCRRCDAHMTVHARHNRLRCHHCGSERALPSVCDSCGSAELDRVGYGTERITEALQIEFPEIDIARIDRDSTRRKGALEAQLNRANSGEARILVGTQMLAKGHHFPKLTLVCILDADRGLFGTDFRSLEHMAQLIVQVAGRAGREKQRGAVLVQTRNPDNPMLQTLVKEGYESFAEIAMSDRRLAELPPFSFMALVRAEASDAREAHGFLVQVADSLHANKSGRLDVMGPAPAPMERLGGRYRAQLLLQSNLRSTLNDSLSRLCTVIDQLPGARRCRWSIDVDPVDLF
ncbi:primosomal protein N' [Granulosicoccus antarcticus]|uniref:Replication restart protein PriA n=1 Tax=Granulosicoccus antarcticus IMCC3135 TaxID=1192854 RepID=A0A2Z2NGL4_9GAMM|nr:primosomal protein N' [Granulosicoccus antarcticus]ASJ70412.1 Primosomal protein N' [Granulosicoccus antarcticus IMCC3135]